MADYKEHCRDCQKRLGKDWNVVHRWLDELFVKMGCHERHRDIRHHEKGIEEVRRKWGDQAAEAARIHIAKDFDGWVPRDEMEVQKWRHGVVQVPPGTNTRMGN
jgi:hypothetical protein